MIRRIYRFSRDYIRLARRSASFEVYKVMFDVLRSLSLSSPEGDKNFLRGGLTAEAGRSRDSASPRGGGSRGSLLKSRLARRDLRAGAAREEDYHISLDAPKPRREEKASAEIALSVYRSRERPGAAGMEGGDEQRDGSGLEGESLSLNASMKGSAQRSGITLQQRRAWTSGNCSSGRA